MLIQTQEICQLRALGFRWIFLRFRLSRFFQPFLYYVNFLSLTYPSSFASRLQSPHHHQNQMHHHNNISR